MKIKNIIYIHYIYCLNCGIQSMIGLELFAKSLRNRQKGAKHAANQDNVTK